jgi:hypothetical protein
MPKNMDIANTEPLSRSKKKEFKKKDDQVDDDS